MTARVATTKAPTKTAAPKVVRKVSVRKPAKTVFDNTEFNAYVPDLQVSYNYIGRKVQGGIWDMTLADEAIAHAENIILFGDTGSGKTLFGEAYASKRRLNYYSVPCDVSVNPADLFGKMIVTDHVGVYEWQDGPITEIVRNGGVLNISEVNMMPPKIAAAMYQLLDGRRYISLMAHKGEIVRAHIGTKCIDKKGKPVKCWCGTGACDDKVVLVIADMNPNYRGTMELNAAFKNRWEHKIPFGYSDEVEKQLLAFPTLREIAKRCREMSGVEIMTPVSTNLLMEFEKFTLRKSLGLDYAMSNFVSAFATDEQSAIEKVMALHRSKLESDISFITGEKKPATDDDLEEIDFDFVNEEN